MALARGKIIKANNEEPDEIEKQISQVRESFLIDQFRSVYDFYFNCRITCPAVRVYPVWMWTGLLDLFTDLKKKLVYK